MYFESVHKRKSAFKLEHACTEQPRMLKCKQLAHFKSLCARVAANASHQVSVSGRCSKDSMCSRTLSLNENLMNNMLTCLPVENFSDIAHLKFLSFFIFFGVIKFSKYSKSVLVIFVKFLNYS